MTKKRIFLSQPFGRVLVHRRVKRGGRKSIPFGSARHAMRAWFLWPRDIVFCGVFRLPSCSCGFPVRWCPLAPMRRGQGSALRRYEGSFIVQCSMKEFDSTVVPLGKVVFRNGEFPFESSMTVEGRAPGCLPRRCRTGRRMAGRKTAALNSWRCDVVRTGLVPAMRSFCLYKI